MDGKGCWRDNVFVERLWKSIKYEEVYLHAYETVGAAHQGVKRYQTFYNQTRPHQALDGQTPGRRAISNPPGTNLRKGLHCPTNRSHLSRFLLPIIIC